MASIAPEQRHPSIYLLGDHLDAALAMGEDLLTEKVALDTPAGKSPLRDWMRQNRDLNDFLSTVRTLEYAMTARLLQARKRAEELKRSENRLRPLIALFVAGTAPLADAAAELGDTDARDFQSADAALTFLRSRGLLAADAAGLEGLSRLAISEMFRQTGDELVFDERGLLQRGLIIRLLVLPNDIGGIRESLEWIRDTLSPRVAISLMAQYYPTHQAATSKRHILLSRRITETEWLRAVSALEEMGIDQGWMQEFDGAAYYYRPDFTNPETPFTDIRDFQS